MKKVLLTAIILVSGLGLAACSTHNQDQAADHATMSKQASYQSGYSNKLGKLGREKHAS